MQQSLSTLPGIQTACRAIADTLSADVLIFNGQTNRARADKLVTLVQGRKRRKYVLLVLVTSGGTAESAYRIARCLQGAYEHFTVLVPGWCKSAGTLCVLGANEIVMADCAELGPLDVQLAKRDELGETSSGLVLIEALGALKRQAFELYEEYMLQIKQHSGGLVSFKVATEIATRMAIGLSEPLLRQIDPIQVGETARSMAIAHAYGERLQVKSKNFDASALELLIEGYPEHGFVIDRREAAEIFRRVRSPNDNENALVAALAESAKYPNSSEQVLEYLTLDIVERKKRETRTVKPARRAGKSSSNARESGNAGNSRKAKTTNRSVPSGDAAPRIRLVKKG